MIDAMETGMPENSIMKVRRRLASVLCSENGQALVEHSLLVGSITGSLAAVRDHPYLVIGIAILLLILLLFWRPKIFATIIFIAVLIAIVFFIYRWVEFGHI
jgi:uncharacterized membrane protein